MFKSLTLQYAIQLLALSNTTKNVHPSDIPLSRTIIINRQHRLIHCKHFKPIPTSPSTHHSFIPHSMNHTWLLTIFFIHVINGQSSYSQLIVHLSPFNSILQGPQRQRDAHMGVLCYSTIPSTATSCPFVWVSQFNVS